MIDINNLRNNIAYFKKATKDKQLDPAIVDEVVKYDKERRDLIQKIETLRKERNEITEKIKNAKDHASKDAKKSIQRVKDIKKELKELEPQLNKIEEQFSRVVRNIPNPASPDVKIGKNDTENEIIRKWGKPRTFDFTPKDHLELGELQDIIDVKRASKVSGARFDYLKGDAVLLEWSLLQLARDVLLKEHFVPVIPPVLIKKESMSGMGYLEHGGEDDMYVFDKDGLVLVGTSEQSIGPMLSGEVIDVKDLPLRFMGYSSCFRRESGSYGKDTRGILRVHQFNKVEMFSFTTPEKGDKEHEFLLSIEEKLFQMLEIPYQVIKMCTGDLGAPAARKYDIEAWMPSQNKYREVTSTSQTTDFQSRRLNIKYRDGETIDYVHMLNGTAFSMNRPIIAILENYQQEDGSIKIPTVLKPYMMGKEIINNL